MNNKQITTTGIILAICIVVSILSAVSASIITQRSLDSYLEALSDEEIVLSLSKVKPTQVPGTYEESLTSVLAQSDSLAFIYPKVENKTKPDSWQFESDAYGVGVVVTSDGWILVHDSVLYGVGDIKQTQVLINNVWYYPTQVVEDTKSDVLMLKVEASNLRAVTFAQSQQAKTGEFVFALDDNSVIVSSLENNAWYSKESSRPAEQFAQYWILQDEVGSGSVLFDSSGYFLGISKAGVEALPLYTFESFIQSVLSGTASSYPAIGAYVISLEQGLNVDSEALGVSKGFMIARMPGYAGAFSANSPARIAGLKEYDVIVSVGGVQVSNNYSLASAIERYKVGDAVEFVVVREGVETTFIITLGEYNLLY